MQSPRLPTTLTNIQPEVVTLSTPRTVTYYYYPKRVSASEPSTPVPQYITVARAPKRTQAEFLTPPSTPPLSYSRTTTPILKSPSTPIIMARGPTTTRTVDFAKEVDSIRAPRDDERSVMEHFAKHADKCQYCRDPYAAWKNDRSLCSRGLSYARDVATYLYAKGGKPYSVIDRQNGDRVQVQVPYGCEAVTLLIKAIDRGMKTTQRIVVENTRRPEPTDRSPVSPSRRREYHDERPRERRYINPEVIEITPHSSRNDRRERNTYRDERREERYRSERRPKSMVYEGKGSLFPQDVEERSRRQQYERQPVIIVAEPGQRYAIRR